MSGFLSIFDDVSRLESKVLGNEFAASTPQDLCSVLVIVE